ncbi:MAG: DUF4124 domain-containing protein [Thermodesulfobacteriota bacterium]
MRSRSFLALVLSLVLLACAVLPASAQLFTWTDEKGVVHMTDRRDKVPAGKGVTVNTPAPAAEGGRAGVIKAMLLKARENPRLPELRELAAEYKRNHTYSMTDYFVCVDMALEMANILKTRQFKASVVAGTVTQDVSGMSPAQMMGAFNHAWVVVELDPGVNVAVETTAGVLAEESVRNFENYYQGLVFKNPRQAKDTDVLIRTVKEDCAKAAELARDFDMRYAGGPATAQALESKGRVEAKIAECNGAKASYAAMIGNQYRKLY